MIPPMDTRYPPAALTFGVIVGYPITAIADCVLLLSPFSRGYLDLALASTCLLPCLGWA